MTSRARLQHGSHERENGSPASWSSAKYRFAHAHQIVGPKRLRRNLVRAARIVRLTVLTIWS